jgi:hypothetical protein
MLLLLLRALLLCSGQLLNSFCEIGHGCCLRRCLRYTVAEGAEVSQLLSNGLCAVVIRRQVHSCSGQQIRCRCCSCCAGFLLLRYLL